MKPKLFIIKAAALLCSSLAASAHASVVLQDNAPEQHVVVAGDTLWDISARFLKNPWDWPKIWQMNQAQVKNPHRIYPGDTIVLDRNGGMPVLRNLRSDLPQVRLSPRMTDAPLSELAISPVAVDHLAGHLDRLTFLTPDQLAAAPRISTGGGYRDLLGAGDIAYTTATAGSVWQIWRAGHTIQDTTGNNIVGRVATLVGEAEALMPDTPAKLRIVHSQQEIQAGDLLLPHADPVALAVAHAPATTLAAHILYIHGGISSAGRHSLVLLDQGHLDGLEAGHVLKIMQSAMDRPAEEVGLLYVFRTLDRHALAVILDANRPVALFDSAVTP